MRKTIIQSRQIETALLKLDVSEGGEGRPLVLLRGHEPPKASDEFIAGIAQSFHVYAPWAPGFGKSELPDEFDSIADVAYAHLELMEKLDLRDAILVGLSFGGWVATEVAVRDCSRIAGIVLVDSMGLRIGDRTDRPIADIYALSETELAERGYANPAKAQWSIANSSDEELLCFARGRAAQARFGWSPYMHNPGLRRWLHRINKPTLVLWGERDRIVSEETGRQFAARIPDAQFDLIAGAGHYPQIEQPAALVKKIRAFADRVNG